ncbi:hypothetical protein L6452_21074 [Arctium lappa]|uniref:Uncharacterized protein n=1 Tax=Arctium lappa TaxID=4217 RepID=A0ACB9BEF9_ARCLA|nr:hypothetical protein L6452_21074 [Arctium lappa]
MSQPSIWHWHLKAFVVHISSLIGSVRLSVNLCVLFWKKNSLGLNVNVNVERSNRRSDETSLVGDSIILGREGDKEALLDKLLENEVCNQNVSIVSIVGMGGIGKTTLAKVLYNQEQVKYHFELKAWVCVSEDFDVFNISKAIFQAVDGNSQEFANLDLLHVALKEKLSNKRGALATSTSSSEAVLEESLLEKSSPSFIIVGGRESVFDQFGFRER